MRGHSGAWPRERSAHWRSRAQRSILARMREMEHAPVEVDPQTPFIDPGSSDATERVGDLTPDSRPRQAAGRMQFRILGSLEVALAGEPLPLGGPQQRAVLAHLIVRANELVPADALVSELWGDEAPESARDTIHTYVSHLRKMLGADRIEGQTPGYRLRLDPSELDAARFDKLVNDARKVGVIDPGHRRHGARRGARALARSGARRCRGQRCAPRRGGTPGRAQARRRRGAHRRAAGDRRASACHRRSRDPGRAAPAQGARLATAHARPVPRGAPGRRARRVPAPAERSSPTSSGSIRHRSSHGSTSRS